MKKVKLKDILNIQYGTRITKKDNVEGQYPVYGGGGITFYTNSSNRSNALIVSRFGMSKKCVRFIRDDFFLNDSGLSVTPANEKELSQGYLYFLIHSLQDFIYSTARGSAQKNIQMEVFLNKEILLPSLEIQLKLVRVLKIAESQSQSIQSTSDTLLQDLSDFRKEILTRAFRGELTEQNIADGTGAELLQSIQLERQQQEAGTKRKKKTELAPVEDGGEPYNLPENWVWTRLGELFSMNYGKNLPTSELKETGYKVFGANGVIGFYSDFIYEESQVVISSRGANSGKMNVTPPKCFITNNSIVLNIDKSKMNNMFFYYLLHQVDRSKIVTGTAQPQVTIENLNQALISLPPLAEQHRIVEKIEAIFAQLDVMEEAILLQKDEASKCYEEILRKSLEGTPELVTA